MSPGRRQGVDAGSRARPRSPGDHAGAAHGAHDAGFTLRVYAKDKRDEATIVKDVLARAAGANVGS